MQDFNFKNQELRVSGNESPVELFEKARAFLETESIGELREIILKPCKSIEESPLYSLKGEWKNSKLIAVAYSLSPKELEQQQLMSCIPPGVKWNIMFGLSDSNRVVPFNDKYWLNFSRGLERGSSVYDRVVGSEISINSYFENLKSILTFKMPTCFYYDWVYAKTKKEPKKYFEFE